MSATSYIEEIFLKEGLAAAYREACRTVQQHAVDVEAMWQSRFFERRILDDGSKKLCPTSQGRISNAYDMSDCEDGPIPEFLYCDVDGELYPISLGQQTKLGANPEAPNEIPCVFAMSDMIANGKVVGSVSYTDH